MEYNRVQRLRADNHLLAGLLHCRQVRENAIADTYRRAKSEWKDNYKYWTELCLVLNHKIWQWRERDKQRAILYDKLWREADAMTAEWSDEEQ